MIPRFSPGLLNPVLGSSKVLTSVTTTALRSYPRLPRTLQPLRATRRLKHTIPRPPERPAPSPESSSTPVDFCSSPLPSLSSSSSPPPPPTPDQPPDQVKPKKRLEPHYQLTFTCVPCGSRSSHTVSKQGYHHGSVLITCHSCRNRHIISDHLGIFGDRKITVEDLMRERGRLVKRGTLGQDGDIEFWEEQKVENEGDAATADPPRDLDALVEEEEVRQLLETGVPPPQLSGTLPRSPLVGGSARPLVPSSTSDPLTTPSTRREYSTESFSLSYVKVGVPQHKASELSALRDSLREEAGWEITPGPDEKNNTTFEVDQSWRRELGREPPVKSARYHRWTERDYDKTFPNERFAQDMASGRRTPLSRLPRDEAIRYIKVRTRKDSAGSAGSSFNVFSKVIANKTEAYEERYADLLNIKLSPRAKLPGPDVPTMANLVRRVPPISVPRSPPLPPRGTVPPWKQRAVFGPGGNSTAPARSTSIKDKKEKLDIWGDDAMSAELRKLIEWGTPETDHSGSSSRSS